MFLVTQEAPQWRDIRALTFVFRVIFLLSHTEIGRCCGMEMNVEKTKVMRISRQPSAVTIMVDQKHFGEGGMF